MKTLITTIEKILSLVLFFVFVFVSLYFFRQIASTYFHFQRAVGGDYYNGLTYAIHFAKHVPFPPSGWLSFWHEGIPIIGGYPTMTFYLLLPLLRFFDPATSLEFFNIGMLFLYFIVSLLLFYLITGSSPAAGTMTMILLVSNNSYYQLFGEGLIASNAVQWLLPASLLFTHLYIRFRQGNFLLAAAGIAGISLILHPAMGLICIVIPNVVFLFISLSSTLWSAVRTVLVFAAVCLAISSVTVVPLISQIFAGNISGQCESAQCWGLYPQHLQLWFNWYTPVIALCLSLSALILKFFKRKISIKPLIAILIAVIILSLYPLAAYFHLIDGLASAIFPRRTFWVLNLLLLVMTAYAYSALKTSWGKMSGYVLSAIFLGINIYVILLAPQLITLDAQMLFNRPDTMPDQIDTYILPKYKKQELSDLLPSWVIDIAEDKNYRFDSLNHQVTVWWNAFADMPSTRGYSNTPSGRHASWLYYFQVGTAENPNTLSEELVRNRTLFLLDHYGVGLYDDSARNSSGGKLGYDKKLLADPTFALLTKSARELSFYKLSPKNISPIVSPTNATPILIISDENGYETVVKALSYTGITSQQLIPVKGPDSIDKISARQLNTFPVLFLYHFKGNRWNALKEYIEKGGSVIAELGSLEKIPVLPNFFPSSSYTESVVQKKLEFTEASSPLLLNVKTAEFAPFIYKNGPWNLWVSPYRSLKSDASSILATNEGTLFSELSLGQGRIFVSGLNLPFHIIDGQNLDEVIFFKNLISLVIKNTAEPAQIKMVNRLTSEIVNVSAAASGIYFKENYDPGWKATSENHSIEVYAAGPEFMYIPTINHETNVTIQYRGTVKTWSLFIISTSAILLSVIFIFLPYSAKKHLNNFYVPAFQKLKSPLSKLLSKENENY